MNEVYLKLNEEDVDEAKRLLNTAGIQSKRVKLPKIKLKDTSVTTEKKEEKKIDENAQIVEEKSSEIDKKSKKQPKTKSKKSVNDRINHLNEVIEKTQKS